MGAEQSSDGKAARDEEGPSLFDACFGPRITCGGERKLKGPPDGFAPALATAPSGAERAQPDGLVPDTDATRAANTDLSARPDAVSSSASTKPAPLTQQKSLGRKAVTWSGSTKGLGSEETASVRTKEEEVRYLKSQLKLLRARPSCRALFMNDEEDLKQRAIESDLARQKDFEIANLKKDLVLSQLRTETAIRTAKNAILGHDETASPRLASHPELYEEDEDEENKDDNLDVQSENADPANLEQQVSDLKSSARSLTGNDGDQRDKDRESKRRSHNLVVALDQQLAAHGLSIDEYALALASLSS